MDEEKILKVSVIMPNYNNSKYIEEAINSALEQTLQDIEIIVIDDCSTDNSLEILQKIQAKHPDKVRIVQNEVNLGAGLSRNVGIDIARGEFIKFLDADDTIDKDVLETMYNSAKENNVKAVLGTVKIMQSKNAKRNNVNNNYEVINVNENKEDVVYGFPAPGDGFFAKELFDKIKFPNLKWEDLATMPALRVAAGNIYYIDKPVNNYRIHEESTTGVDQRKKNPRVFDIVKCLDKLREEIPEEYKTELDALEYMNYQLRMEEISLWEDCSEEHKKILINSLNKIMKLQIPDLDRNPYIKIIKSAGEVQLDELRNGDYIQVGMLEKEKTFEIVQKEARKYYKYKSKDRKARSKSDQNGEFVTSYIDKTELESEESAEEILSGARNSGLNEQCLDVLQKIEELINASGKKQEDIARETLDMAKNIILNEELIKKDKIKTITAMYKILHKNIPNLEEIIEKMEESLYCNNDDIDMYLDEDMIKADSVEEILADVQKLVSSEEFLRSDVFSEQEIVDATESVPTGKKDEANDRIKKLEIQQHQLDGK